jgi:hypothetical protein
LSNPEFSILIQDKVNRSQQCNQVAMHSSRSHDAVIRVYDDAGNMIETHEHAGDFVEP